MTWHHVYRLKTAELGVRTLLRKLYHPKVETFAVKFPPTQHS